MSRQPANIASAFEKVRADYDMSRESRFVRRRTGLAPEGGTADYHYRNETAYYRDIEKARDMDRNDAIVGQTVDRAVANIVQEGFTLDPKTGSKQLNQELKGRFNEWAQSCDHCDISGEYTFHDMERQVMRSTLIDGDIVALATVGGQLQLLEAHTIKKNASTSNNVVLGVELDEFRKRKRYYVTTDSISNNGVRSSRETPKDVRDINGHRQLFHVYNAKRITQTRGVTAFAPIFAPAGMFEDIQFAKMVQQQIVSCFAIFREQASNVEAGIPSVDGGEYGQVTTESTDSGVRTIKGIQPGMEFIGGRGEKLHGFSPNVPNSEYFNHVRLILQIIGVNLGLPLCLVLMDGSETNFSGWRGAVDEARKGFKANQDNLKKRFHTPIYEWKLRQFLSMPSSGDLRREAERLGNKFFAHSWNSPAWQYIEPLKDAQGDAFQLQNALTSPRRLHGRRGNDWDDISDEIVEDYAMAVIKAKRMALEINTSIDDDQPVHWRELMPIVMPSGLKMDIKDPNALAQEKEAQQ